MKNSEKNFFSRENYYNYYNLNMAMYFLSSVIILRIKHVPSKREII